VTRLGKATGTQGSKLRSGASAVKLPANKACARASTKLFFFLAGC